MPNTWDNRIVEYDPAVPLDQLLAHPRNPKIHPTAQTDALRGILGDVGWLTGLIVNTRTGHMLDGHDRVKAAMQAGQTTAPVFYVDVPEDMEPYVLATFDPVGSLAGTDSAVLADLLREVSSADSAVQALLARIADEPAIDPAELWRGMPEYENEAQAARSLHVHFLTEADCTRFCEVLGLRITDKTKTVWYPAAPVSDKYIFGSSDES